MYDSLEDMLHLLDKSVVLQNIDDANKKKESVSSCVTSRNTTNPEVKREGNKWRVTNYYNNNTKKLIMVDY